MKRLGTALAVAVVLAVGGCSQDKDTDEDASPPTAGASLDLVYLDHPPVQPVLEDIDKVLTAYEGEVEVSRHDADTPEGQDFAEKHDLTGHVMIAVLIDGKVRFKGFPVGRAPMKAAEGDWRIEDLDTALRERTRSEAP
ncbi:hypothetical protein ACFYOV_26995 [Streptomyces sp. NPDC005931]|uniref:hypothetical protein n=1 Tax=Streptomyces sp. NPDC005931 TaxID=3364737 RepID=UPI0036AFCB82